MSYTAMVWRAATTSGSSVYVALHPALPGCFAQGDTPEQARRALDEVRADYLDHLRATRQPVPESDVTWPLVRFECGEIG